MQELENRIFELEIKLAENQRDILELNAIILQQTKQIQQLQQKLILIQESVLATNSSGLPFEKPPHY